jgi:aspartyl-tRNA(Asn)/glutamyl-tRNA(Gln) amidotransferase subunit B
MRTISHPKYEAVIGLEVHSQLLTQSKAFAAVTPEFGNAPNTNVTPLCLGHPGTLPVLNENLVNYIIKMGLATDCKIAERSIFARKNYFYPDLPKGYQISQFDTPICYDGFVDIEVGEGVDKYVKRIGVTRIHMEEDAGKSIHDQDPFNTLIDLNRAGTALIEIVSEPDLRTPAEAGSYLRLIKQIVQYLEICDGNMEEGSLRCDANVSVRPRGQEKLGTRTELKNMNSFSNVEKAIQYEIERQIELVESGGTVIQQTLLWDSNKMVTRKMRSKEDAHDYRYFPEPDIPPVVVTKEHLDSIRAELPELATKRQKRFMSDMGMSKDDAVTLTDDRYLADYFENVNAIVNSPKATVNVILSQVLRVLNEESINIKEFSIDAPRLAALIQMKEADKISSTGLQSIFADMLKSEDTAEAIAKRLNLLQVSDNSFLEPIIDSVMANSPDEVARFREGKKNLMGFFVGQIMKETKGRANPKEVTSMLMAKLNAQ